MLHRDCGAVLICLPIYHIAACSNLLFNLTHGLHTVLVANARDIPALVNTFAKVRPTFFSGVNTLFDALLNHAEFAALDFSQLRLCLQGGTALRRATAERWKAVTGCEVIEGYGLSETSAAITYNRPQGPNPAGSIGLALAENEISVRDESGQVVAVGVAGELCVRGPQVTSGYWNQAEETRNAFFDDGWFRSGDIARVDEAGFHFILDRRKDMILVSGFNVYPNEWMMWMPAPWRLDLPPMGWPMKNAGEAVGSWWPYADCTRLSCARIAQASDRYRQPKTIGFAHYDESAVGNPASELR